MRQATHNSLTLPLVAAVVAFVAGYLTGRNGACLSTYTHGAVVSPHGHSSSSGSNRVRAKYLDMGAVEGVRPFRTPTTLAAEPLIQNPWLLVESHTVLKPTAPATAREAEKQQRTVPASKAVITNWWWVDVPDHVNVIAALDAAVVRRLLAMPQEELPFGLQRLQPSAMAKLELRKGEGAGELFVLLRQTKYALRQKMSYAVIGGLANSTADGSLQATAVRELREETGLRSDGWVSLGDKRVDANRGCGVCGVFLARHCDLDPNYVNPADGDTGDLEPQTAHLVALDDLRDIVLHPKVLELKWSHTMAVTVLYYDRLARGGSAALGGGA